MSWRANLLCVLAAAAIVAGAIPSAFAAQTSATTRTQVVEDEWRLTPSRSRVRPGTLKIEVVNMGEDDHDFVIARAGGGLYYDSSVIAPGERAEFKFKVKRGTYKLWCAIANHADRGMRSKIRVR